MAADIPYARHHVDDEDVAAVTRVLRSAWLTQGPAAPAFEAEVAGYCGAPHAVALSSGTVALYAACHAVGVRPGDRVWTSPNSFVASANCARYCGAEVDFVDIDPYTYNMSVEDLQTKLDSARKTGTLPKVLIVVHFGGQPADLAPLSALTRSYGVLLIEDASHALGSTYKGERLGSCRYSEATVFSFHSIKTIAAAEGGMVLTRSESIRDAVRLFRTHGITRDQAKMDSELAQEPWKYEQISLGFNFRMTDLQAALGTSQMNKIGRFLERRNALSKRYDDGFSDLPLQLPYRDDESTSAWHLYPIQTVGEDRARVRLLLYQALLKNGIASQVHYIPIHTQPYYRALGFRRGDFPKAERYYEGTLSLPLFYDLEDDEQDRVIETVRAVLS